MRITWLEDKFPGNQFEHMRITQPEDAFPGNWFEHMRITQPKDAFPGNQPEHMRLTRLLRRRISRDPARTHAGGAGGPGWEVAF